MMYIYIYESSNIRNTHGAHALSAEGENYSVVWAPSRERRYTHNRIEDIAAEACGYVYSLVSRFRA